MLEYLRTVLAEFAITTVNVTTLDDMYEAATLVAVDRFGIVLAGQAQACSHLPSMEHCL